MMILTRSQRILLEAIDKHDGEWNWYKLGRLCLSQLDSPADFVLGPFLDAGYVEEKLVEGEPLPRLRTTQAGKEAIRLILVSEAVPR
jgi:hypothetical protein